MTNLNIPGLGTFADVAAYMQGVGEAARAAARHARPRRHGGEERGAGRDGRGDPPRRGEARSPRTPTDVAAARAAGQDAAFVDRLTLTPKTIAAMAEGLEQIAALPDPVGEITDLKFRPSGIQVGMMRVPLGVVGIIYESRPNVTADAAGLCLKAGNATILRGGSEALREQPGDRRVRARGPARRRPAREWRAGRSPRRTARRSVTWSRWRSSST